MKCNCGNQSESGQVQLGLCYKNTGWLPLFGVDGGIKYVCPSCAEKLIPLVHQMVEITGTENVYIAGILRNVKNSK